MRALLVPLRLKAIPAIDLSRVTVAEVAVAFLGQVGGGGTYLGRVGGGGTYLGRVGQVGQVGQVGRRDGWVLADVVGVIASGGPTPLSD